MEARMRRAAAAALVAVLAAAWARGQDAPPRWFQELEKRFPPVARNAAASDLEDLAIELGLDPQAELGESRPDKRDREAFLRAGVGGWLDAQLQTSDDAIGAGTAPLLEYLEGKGLRLSRAAAVLGKQVPEWGFDLREDPNPPSMLLSVLQLNKILLAAALVEERAEHHDQAAAMLEASWSLHRSLAWRPELRFQLSDVAVLRSLAGALRKMAQPGPEWIERMTTRQPMDRVLESLETDVLIFRAQAGGDTDPRNSGWLRLAAVVVSQLKALSACEVSRISAAEIWKRASAELATSLDDEERTELQVIGETSVPNLTSAIHRAGRLIVDCEMTARIVELRQERAAARPRTWPEALQAPESRACKGALYDYHAAGGAMRLRFKGSVGEPEAPAAVLPLSYEARAPQATPTPTPAHRAAPTPRPVLTPGRAGA